MNSVLTPRPVSYSAVREQVYLVFPNDLNSSDTVFGGQIMALMDRYAAVAADRHAGSVCVTVGVDAVHFIAPARKGDVLIFNAAVNRAWGSSMEVGVKVEATPAAGGERRHVLSAYLTFVSMRDGKPSKVPAVIAETTEERHRFDEAQLRRELRLQHAENLKKFRFESGRRAR